MKRYNLPYRDQTHLEPIDNGVSLLVNVQVEGHGPGSEMETMPPVAFGYTEFDGSSKDLITLNQDHLPALSLADPSMNMGFTFLFLDWCDAVQAAKKESFIQL